jgi:hypothetical protein
MKITPPSSMPSQALLVCPSISHYAWRDTGRKALLVSTTNLASEFSTCVLVCSGGVVALVTAAVYEELKVEAGD